MQLIDLSGVESFHAARFLLYWLIATVVSVIVAYRLTPEEKVRWFKQRKGNGLMVRRGPLGNFSLLGMPNTKEGGIITAGIFGVSLVIWALLVYLILPVVGHPV